MIHPDDAALMYDGPLPAAVRAQLDPRAPRRFAGERRSFPAKVTPKPAAVRARMAQVMAAFAARGGLTESDLVRAGFTAAEIARHRADALRLVFCAHPGLLTLEMPA